MLSDERPAAQQMTTGDQLNQAVMTAEGMLDRAERTAGQCRVLRVIELGVVALAVFALTGWMGLARFVGGTRLTVVSAAGVLIAVFLAIVIYRLLEYPLRQRLARDARAIVEIIDLVRELMPLIARHEEWSELEIMLFRSRLSRFPVGPRGVR